MVGVKPRHAAGPQAAVPLSVPLLPDGPRARTYARWAGLVGVAFFAVYPTMNWFTDQRPNRLHLYVSPELGIPFMPAFIWAYLSMYVLFLMPLCLLPAARLPSLGKQLLVGTLMSGLLFLLLPADLGFVRVVPADPVYGELYATIFGIDRPHNLVPSLHVIWSSAIILACADIARTPVRVFLHGWLAIVVTSTVLVHQHHILDIAAAALLVVVLRRIYRDPHA
jgi:membrane-associated phospholipid phosphatase